MAAADGFGTSHATARGTGGFPPDVLHCGMAPPVQPKPELARSVAETRLIPAEPPRPTPLLPKAATAIPAPLAVPVRDLAPLAHSRPVAGPFPVPKGAEPLPGPPAPRLVLPSLSHGATAGAAKARGVSTGVLPAGSILCEREQRLRRFAPEEWRPRPYGPASASALALTPVLPDHKIRLITGERLWTPAVHETPPRETTASIPPAAPLLAARCEFAPTQIRTAPLPAVHPPVAAGPARSVEALRRAKETAHPSPPMCVRIAPRRTKLQPSDDRSTLPQPPSAAKPVETKVAPCVPSSGLAPQTWADAPALQPLPAAQPIYQPPPEAPAPVLKPVLPLPVAPPAAGPPVPRFRWTTRQKLRRTGEWLRTPAAWAVAAMLAAAAGLPPAMTHLGGSGGVRQSGGRMLAGFEEKIARRSGVRFVEDFGSRFDKWEGRRDLELSWKIDDASFVIPGELAVFKPSAPMADYRVEFLAGIERRAISWAFRVQDLSNYYVAKVIVARPGPLPGLALERYAVLGGKETPRRTNPISLTIRGGSMMRVSMNAKGSDFDVRIDGRIVDSWSDDRIPAGGVGLFSAKGESSKIRWMKVEHQYDILGRVCSWFAGPPAAPGNSRSQGVGQQ